jgi:protein tyrosine/serine phosphatase
MTSEKKAETNRKNAASSTGPKTSRGKLKSSGNAVKHGGFSTKHLLEGEDAALYESIASEQKNRFNAKTYIEKALVSELINQLWTLRRLERAERFYLSESRDEAIADAVDDLTQQQAELLRASSSDSLSREDRKKSAVIEKQLLNSNRFYAAAFVYDGTGRVQRVAAQRRTALQTILNLERELERRVRQPKKKKSIDE